MGEAYVGHDDVVGGDAVAGDEEERLIIDGEDVAHLARRDQRELLLELLDHGGGLGGGRHCARVFGRGGAGRMEKKRDV